MLKYYVLRQRVLDGRYIVDGIEYIHGGILSSEGDKTILLMDTTLAEDEALSNLALEVREASQKERTQFESVFHPPSMFG